MGSGYYLEQMDWQCMDYMAWPDGFVGQSFQLPGLETIIEQLAYYELQIYFVLGLAMDLKLDMVSFAIIWRYWSA